MAKTNHRPCHHLHINTYSHSFVVSRLLACNLVCQLYHPNSDNDNTYFPFHLFSFYSRAIRALFKLWMCCFTKHKALKGVRFMSHVTLFCSMSHNLLLLVKGNLNLLLEIIFSRFYYLLVRFSFRNKRHEILYYNK